MQGEQDKQEGIPVKGVLPGWLLVWVQGLSPGRGPSEEPCRICTSESRPPPKLGSWDISLLTTVSYRLKFGLRVQGY